MTTNMLEVKKKCRSPHVSKGGTLNSRKTARRDADFAMPPSLSLPTAGCPCGDPGTRGLTHSKPRKANECLAEAKRSRPRVRLFDEFWREGELALLFGAAGTGKSVLAMQIADALARGAPLLGFDMPRRWRKVLYVDLRLSDAQFLARYGRSGDTPVPNAACSVTVSNAETASVRTRASSLRFAENLYRERPGGEDDPFEWIRATVAANGFRVVVIDDISAIKRTCDGVRETLLLMRNLKRLCRDTGVSILVISGAEVPSDGWESEADLKRSRIMCSVADSVFSLGRKRMPEGARRLMQTRTSGAELVWNHKNAPEGNIKKLETGMLGFEFDDRFSEAIDDHLRELIMCVDEMRERGESYRKIEEVYGISKSYAHSLHKKWGPLARRLREEEAEEKRKMQNAECKISEEDEDEDGYEDEWDEAGFDKPVWLEEECTMQDAECTMSVPPAVAGGLSPDNAQPPTTSTPLGDAPAGTPHAVGTDPGVAEPDRRSIYDLEVGRDSYGRTIYVESRTNAGRPTVWYQIDRQGTPRRFKRGTFGIQVEHLNSGPFL